MAALIAVASCGSQRNPTTRATSLTVSPLDDTTTAGATAVATDAGDLADAGTSDDAGATTDPNIVAHYLNAAALGNADSATIDDGGF